MSGSLKSRSNRARLKPARLSHEKFIGRVRDLQADIQALQSSLLYSRKIFRKEKIIGPQHCTCVLDSVFPLYQAQRDFYDLLAAAALLPRSVIPLRYDLLIALYHLKKQTREFSLRVMTFRSLCRTGKLTGTLQKQEVLSQFEQIIEDNNEVIENTNFLLDQARFLERQLAGFESK